MTRTWRWRGVGIAAAVLIVGWLLVPLITLHGAQARILSAIQAGIGRQLSADAVHLRLLPWPGVELDNVRLADAPAFGAEDMVVADDATASVRLLPLLAGRLEFARIHLDDPSINLVRNQAGRWNVAALLERASQPGAANAAQRRVAAPFPYFDWTDARINFKLDQTKTRLYLDQVEGSLAHDSQGWRLHASFVPERSDVNLSNPGEVTLDGRWPDNASAFRQRPFDVELRLRDSYLAASSALVAGHDAGVHGVLAAQIHIAPAPGTGGAGFLITGSASAQSVRRWDLMPPPVSISGAFAGVYLPAQDRFELTGAGDAGFKRVRVSGAIANVFTGFSLALHAGFDQYPAANLMPALLALKSNVPPDVKATGTVSGSADLTWSPWDSQHSSPSVGADLKATDLVLSSGADQLHLASAHVTGKANRLRLPATPATVTAAPNSAPVPIGLMAQTSGSGFQVQISSPSLTRGASQSLCRILGLRSPWPSDIDGTARVKLDLGGTWSRLRNVGWTGSVAMSKARFQPAGGPGLELEDVRVSLNQPHPARLQLSALWPQRADAPRAGVSVTAQAPAAPLAPWQFSAHAQQLDSLALWQWLQPRPADLMQRVFGTAPAGWSDRLRLSGALDVADLVWHGVHAGVRLQLRSAAGVWQAPQLSLKLAGGEFSGAGKLQQGLYEINGAVAPAEALALQPLLEGTPYQGWVRGQLSGTLQLSRPAGSADINSVKAEGSFEIRRGAFATARGWRPFERLSGHYQLNRGTATLTQVVLVTEGQRWTGTGQAATTASGVPTLTLDLRRTGTQPAAAWLLEANPESAAVSVPRRGRRGRP